MSGHRVASGRVPGGRVLRRAAAAGALAGALALAPIFAFAAQAEPAGEPHAAGAAQPAPPHDGPVLEPARDSVSPHGGSEHGAAGHGAAGHGAAGHGAGHGADGATEHGAAGHGGAHDGPPAPINWFDFSNKEQPPYGAHLINFALLVFLYVRFGKKPVAEGLQKRRETIMKDIEEASKMEAEARERAKTYQAKLANLSQESAEARHAIVTAGEGEKQRMVQEAAEKAERMRRDVEFLLEQETKELREQLQRDAVEAASHGALELLRRSVTPQDHQRFAEEYLRTLEKMASQREGGAPPREPSVRPDAAPRMEGGAS